MCLIARVLFQAAGTLGGPDEGVLTTALVGCGRPAESYGVDLRIVDTEVCVVCVTVVVCSSIQGLDRLDWDAMRVDVISLVEFRSIFFSNEVLNFEFCFEIFSQ